MRELSSTTQMPQNFFVPFADSMATAEKIYNLYIEKTGNPLAHPNSRIRRIDFSLDKQGYYVAEVDKALADWPGPGGRVFAIIQFKDFFQVFTTFCAWKHPIRIKLRNVIEVDYFSDYPAED